MAQSSFSRTLPLLQMLNYNPTNEAFEKGKRAFAAQEYDDAVKHYTDALKAIEADISSVIYTNRAAAYEKQNKYDLATADNRAAHFARTNAEAVPQATAQRDMLTMKYGQALTPAGNQNQYLVQALPSEVLSCILSSLSTKDCVYLGMTCRFWYNFMFHKWPRMWHTVDPGKDFRSFSLISSTRRYVKAIQAEQIKDLHLNFSSADNPTYHGPGENVRRNRRRRTASEDSGNVLLDFMDHRWSGAELLTMRYCTETLFDRVSYFVGKNLKKLTLTRSSHKNNYGIHILKKAALNFPKLQTMINDFGEANYEDGQLLHYLEEAARVSDFQLTSLSMPKQLGQSIDHVFQNVPELTSLNVDSSYIKNLANLLESVHRHCPTLESFNCSRRAAQKLSTTHTRSAMAFIGGGLKTLILRPSQIHSDTNVNPPLDSMLQRACKSLQTLDLHLDMLENGQFSALNTIAQSGAPHLQALTLEASQNCSIGSQSISNLISACPSLMTVRLTGADFWHDRILTVLANSSRLRKLSIEIAYRDRLASRQGTDGDGAITTQGLTTFFERAQGIDDFSYNHYPGNIYILHQHLILGLVCAASLSSVRKLDLSTNQLKSETLLQCLRYLQRSQVQTLKILIACPIGDREINELSAIPHLTDLTIYDDKNYIDEDKVCTLLDRWQYPQMLVVRIHSKYTNFFIKGYKADLGTMRQAKERITDKILRYSITSSKPPQPLASSIGAYQLLSPFIYTPQLDPSINTPLLDHFLGPIPLDTFNDFRPIEASFRNRSQMPDMTFDLEQFMMGDTEEEFML